MVKEEETCYSGIECSIEDMDGLINTFRVFTIGHTTGVMSILLCLAGALSFPNITNCLSISMMALSTQSVSTSVMRQSNKPRD